MDPAPKEHRPPITFSHSTEGLVLTLVRMSSCRINSESLFQHNFELNLNLILDDLVAQVLKELLTCKSCQTWSDRK